MSTIVLIYRTGYNPAVLDLSVGLGSTMSGPYGVSYARANFLVNLYQQSILEHDQEHTWLLYSMRLPDGLP